MEKETDLVVLNIKRPDEAMFKRSKDILELARGWEIATPEGAVLAGEDLKAVKRLAKQVNEKRLAITRPINEGLKEVNAFLRPAKDLLADAEQLLKAKILKFQTDQDRIARELQAELDAEAREERERLERMAAMAETLDRPEKAEELREEAEIQTAPIIQSAAPKIAGVSVRKTWKAEITDKGALLRHIVEERPDLLGIVSISQSALNDLARLHKEELNFPGVKASEEASIAARSH